MAKSLGNVVLVEELIRQAEQLMPGRSGALIRYTLLATHWQKPLDWSEEILVKNAVLLKQLESNFTKASLLPNASSQTQEEALTPILEALSENFNTPLVLSHLTHLSKKVPLNVLQKGFESLGFDEILWPALGEAFHQQSIVIPEYIQALFEARLKARQEKDYARSDELRKTLEEEGWLIQDTQKNSQLKKKM